MQPEPATVPSFEELWGQLESDLKDDVCRYLDHFGPRGIIGRSLSRLEHAQPRENKEAWAREWALRLAEDNAENDPEAWEYDVYRKLCLEFLYRVIDKKLLLQFGSHRADRIVRTCLVMDRANALFNRINDITKTRGLHWYAEVDSFWMEHLLEGPEEIQILRQSGPPLDRRLRALLDDDEFEYKDDTEILGWMIPKKLRSSRMRVFS